MMRRRTAALLAVLCASALGGGRYIPLPHTCFSDLRGPDAADLTAAPTPLSAAALGSTRRRPARVRSRRHSRRFPEPLSGLRSHRSPAEGGEFVLPPTRPARPMLPFPRLALFLLTSLLACAAGGGQPAPWVGEIRVYNPTAGNETSAMQRRCGTGRVSPRSLSS